MNTKQKLREIMLKLLQFVPKTHPILREVMPKVEDFKEPTLQKQIADMCYSIKPDNIKAARGAYDSAAGMAANQWGIRRRVFIFTPEGSDEDNPLDVMINPSYLPYLRNGEKEPSIVGSHEGCFSVPLTTAVVYRYDAILATYYNQAGKKIERIMEGWEARVFQHETDHLNGKLFDGKLDDFPGPDCKDRVIFKNKAEMEQFWQKR